MLRKQREEWEKQREEKKKQREEWGKQREERKKEREEWRKQREEKKKEEIKNKERQELNAQTDKDTPALPSSPSSGKPYKVSKNRPSGRKAGKLLLLGTFFCILLCGGWALTQVGVPTLDSSIPFGDAKELGRDLFSEADILVSSIQKETVKKETDQKVSTPEETVKEETDQKVSTPEETVKKETDQKVSTPSENYTNSAGMEFVLIPAGEFFMGSPETETDRQADESPLHGVQIEKSFYLGKYEVTLEEWQKVMGIEPLSSGEPGLPATNISWEEARAFVSKLNALESTDRYRLPSEAEWEYACRAKSRAKFSFGADKSNLSEYAWWKENPDIGSSLPHPVGLKKANLWGLYDMHGNVWEWVEDSWYADYSSAPSDGRAREKEDSSYRIARGGSVESSSSSCRAANRAWFSSDIHNSDTGFRVLMEV